MEHSVKRFLNEQSGESRAIIEKSDLNQASEKLLMFYCIANFMFFIIEMLVIILLGKSVSG